MNSLPPKIAPRDRLIVALDFPTMQEALASVQELSGDVGFFKIGLQLFTAAGPGIVRAVRSFGVKVFLDLKLHDIPNTVAGAVQSARELDVQMLTVHLSGGRAMLESAVAATGPELALLGVTVLTSTDAEALHEAGIPATVEAQVERLAQLGIAAGIRGLVASPHEVQNLRRQFGTAIKIIVPGVRPSWTKAGDQKRFATPHEAIKSGADYLVVGRPITAHANPREALSRIIEEIST